MLSAYSDAIINVVRTTLAAGALGGLAELWYSSPARDTFWGASKPAREVSYRGLDRLAEQFRERHCTYINGQRKWVSPNTTDKMTLLSNGFRSYGYSKENCFIVHSSQAEPVMSVLCDKAEEGYLVLELDSLRNVLSDQALVIQLFINLNIPRPWAWARSRAMDNTRAISYVFSDLIPGYALDRTTPVETPPEPYEDFVGQKCDWSNPPPAPGVIVFSWYMPRPKARGLACYNDLSDGMHYSLSRHMQSIEGGVHVVVLDDENRADYWSRTWKYVSHVVIKSPTAETDETKETKETEEE